PSAVLAKVDSYVDSLAPQIQPRIAAELDVFQQRTVASLEEQVVAAFRSLFAMDNDGTARPGGGGRALDANAPDAYGIESLPFADEIARLPRSFSKIADDAGDALRDIFDLPGDEPQQQQQQRRQDD